MRVQKRRRKKRSFFVKLMAAMAVIIIAYFSFKIISDTGYQALNPNDTKFKAVTIKSGSTPQEMGDTLQKEKIIRSSRAFAKYAKQYGSEKLIAGTYLLSAAQDVESIYKQMTIGPTAAPQLPEGYAYIGNTQTPEQTAQSIATATNVPSAKILQAYDDKDLIKKMEAKYPQLMKGVNPSGKTTYKLYDYVYPGVYNLKGSGNADAVVEKLLGIANDDLKPYYSEMKANGIPAPTVISLTSVSGKSEFERRLKFIKKIAPYAQELSKEYGILASISIAQAAHESNWDSSILSSKYNNYYGVKTQDERAGKSVVLETSEVVDGETQTQKARFAVYKSWKDSMKQHAETLAKGNTWNPDQFKDVLAAKNYKQAAKALQDDSYATDTNYTQLLIKLIESWNLEQYDK
ncbi:endolytic transglycosylase MltG [Convivina intestini]|uniref:Flagellum-specific peptidoglycan hydrolase FlgJ n=1 Tax=Convivina intestini TaxID=1505726 RepID=A0A2U1D5V1_9LACO|nr:endolytic transglycosylase MltG [Convivina intestini]PVY83054.1 flagellum-specific peptidoglycan hydrolase FlgJ [Convivina intestini]CAH1856453.1 Endolytic murein transglycosylase [Convivina intestini]SDB99062.1 Flagellum-specific peptidoglycan hydrolase FlgJ [Leuconostocaceae bacterium R-53105]